MGYFILRLSHHYASLQFDCFTTCSLKMSYSIISPGIKHYGPRAVEKVRLNLIVIDHCAIWYHKMTYAIPHRTCWDIPVTHYYNFPALQFHFYTISYCNTPTVITCQHSRAMQLKLEYVSDLSSLRRWRCKISFLMPVAVKLHTPSI